MNWYVEVVGPYDAVFVGPFTSMEAAYEHARGVNRDTFNTAVMDESAMRRSVALYGDCPVVSPEGAT